jgi:drug/metabolite transporter (DMT)-like permease
VTLASADLASLMIVTSGAAHAVVNAILKSGKDKMSSRALIDGFSALIVLPAAFVVPLPHGAWTWLLASWATHLVYLYCLIRSFEVADMSVAYPIARGIAPALASVVAVSVFGEAITWPIAAGIALVSGGVITVGLGRHVQRRALAWAGATGMTIALYTVIDAQGVRVAPSACSYIVWTYLALGGGIGVLFAAWRGSAFLVSARAEWRAGLMAGALSIVTYGLALASYRIGGTPRLAGLREISILFGVGIAVVFLKERITRARAFGVMAIAAGAVTLLLGR